MSVVAGAEQLEAVAGAGTVDGGGDAGAVEQLLADGGGDGLDRGRAGDHDVAFDVGGAVSPVGWCRRRRSVAGMSSSSPHAAATRPKASSRASQANRFFLSKGCPPWASNRCPAGDRSSRRTVGRPCGAARVAEVNRQVNAPANLRGGERALRQPRRRARVRAISCRRRWVSTVPVAVDVAPSGRRVASSQARVSSARLTSRISSRRACSSGSSTGTSASTRRSRLRGIRSAEPMSTVGRPGPRPLANR